MAFPHVGNMLSSEGSRSSKTIWQPEIVGTKAYNLIRLPRSWTPPFISFTSTFVSSLENHLRLDATVPSEDILSTAERVEVTSFIEDCEKWGSNYVIVRSSAYPEELSDRGAYESLKASLSLVELWDVLIKVAKPNYDGTLKSDGKRICVLLQPFVEPVLLGHLSNERRVSSKADSWIVEYHGSGKHSMEELKVEEGFVEEEELRCNRLPYIIEVLKKVAKFGYVLNPQRAHFEWLWDGSRIWVVQFDVSEERTDKRALDYLSKKATSTRQNISESDFEVLRSHKLIDTSAWAKLDRVRVFKEAGLPHATIYVIDGATFCEATENAQAMRNFEDDLKRLLVEPVVVRLDYSRRSQAKASQEATLLLKRSSTLRIASDVIQFMKETSNSLQSTGVSENDFAFLIANFLPARVSAMAYGEPTKSTVRLDALWGLPDGLLYFSHDSYECFLTSHIIKKHVRFKLMSLIPTDSGEWQSVETPSPFDWQRCLSDEEAFAIAKWSRVLADYLKNPVQLMALARIDGQRGESGCLPWHFTTLELPQPDSGVEASFRLYKGAILVCDRKTFEKLRASSSPKEGIFFRPNPEFLRDIDFVREVATFAAEKRVRIYFEGSLLAHAYYVMKRAGAPVICVDAAKFSTPAIPLRKLVRDKIPDMILQSGNTPRGRTLTGEEAVSLLKQKLIEESFEVWNSAKDSLAEEIADVAEVLKALAEYSNIPESVLSRILLDKREKRGGFSKLIYLDDALEGSVPPADSSQTVLFDEMSKILPGEKSSRRKPEHFELEETENDITISVPLVPSLQSKEPALFQKRIMGNYVMTAKYQGNRLLLRILPYRERSNPTQLSLFASDDGDE